MKPYNLEVGWSADDLHAARLALRACKEINPDDPSKAAQAIPPAFEALKKIADWDFDLTRDGAPQARELARRALLQATDREEA